MEYTNKNKYLPKIYQISNFGITEVNLGLVDELDSTVSKDLTTLLTQCHRCKKC